jgi:alanine racemase
VMMNHVVIDVTRAAPREGQITATLLGRDGEEQVSADQLAVWAQTINYEIVTRIGAHLRRIVI